MQTTITKIDGIFGTTDLSNITWTDYTSQTLELYQLLTLSSGDGIPDGAIINRGIGYIYEYHPNTDEWVGVPNGFFTDNTMNYNLVFLRNSAGESGGACYVCKDEEIMKIPNITTNSTFRIRINGSVTYSNYDKFRRMQPQYSSGDVIPIMPVCKSDDDFKYLCVQKRTDHKKVEILVRTLNANATLVNTGGYPFPSAKQYLTNATDKPIQDLDTRVSILENKVAALEVLVAKHDQILKDLPAIVSAVSADVSKLYVAR